jgi:hypothetical protein
MNPYRIGETVTGIDVGGKRFTGRVVQIIGPSSVVLAEGKDEIWTPLSLIHGHAPAEDAPPAPMPPAASPAPVAQLSLF